MKRNLSEEDLHVNVLGENPLILNRTETLSVHLFFVSSFKFCLLAEKKLRSARRRCRRKCERINVREEVCLRRCYLSAICCRQFACVAAASEKTSRSVFNLD